MNHFISLPRPNKSFTLLLFIVFSEKMLEHLIKKNIRIYNLNLKKADIADYD